MSQCKVLDLGEEFGEFEQHGTITDWYIQREKEDQVCRGLSAGKSGEREIPSYAFVLHGYQNDYRKRDFLEAMRGFVQHGNEAIQGAEPHIWSYYQESEKRRSVESSNFDDDFEIPVLKSPKEVWNQLKFSFDVHVRRRDHGSKAVYIVLEGSCTWNTDGLCLVLLAGTKVTRVSGYDGHLANSDAYAMPDLEGAVVATSTHFTSSAWPTATQHSTSSDFFSWACCGAGY